jgi:hypothetical protein
VHRINLRPRAKVGAEHIHHNQTSLTFGFRQQPYFTKFHNTVVVIGHRAVADIDVILDGDRDPGQWVNLNSGHIDQCRAVLCFHRKPDVLRRNLVPPNIDRLHAIRNGVEHCLIDMYAMPLAPRILDPHVILWVEKALPRFANVALAGETLHCGVEHSQHDSRVDQVIPIHGGFVTHQHYAAKRLLGRKN